MTGRVTLKDIADDTGLSISTVSRVLSNKGKISRKSVRKVFESAQRLNYPIFYTQAPTELRSSLSIALVTNFHPGEFHASFYNGFLEAAKGSGTWLALFHVERDRDKTIDLINSIKRKHFDAVVLYLPGFKKADYIELQNLNDAFPVVSAAPIATPAIDTVVFDNYSGGYLVAKYFHEQGFRKLGVIQGPSDELETHLRKNGFNDYCEQHGLEIVWKHKTDYELSSGKHAFKEFLSLSNKPEAIFFGNDALAIGFVNSAARHGLHIPADIAIAGYDNIPACEYVIPSITSVNTPHNQLGESIINLLKAKLKDPNSAKKTPISTTLVPVNLIERESSRAV